MDYSDSDLGLDFDYDFDFDSYSGLDFDFDFEFGPAPHSDFDSVDPHLDPLEHLGHSCFESLLFVLDGRSGYRLGFALINSELELVNLEYSDVSSGSNSWLGLIN